jgi:hypothetical protein
MFDACPKGRRNVASRDRQVRQTAERGNGERRQFAAPVSAQPLFPWPSIGPAPVDTGLLVLARAKRMRRSSQGRLQSHSTGFLRRERKAGLRHSNANKSPSLTRSPHIRSRVPRWQARSLAGRPHRPPPRPPAHALEAEHSSVEPKALTGWLEWPIWTHILSVNSELRNCGGKAYSRFDARGRLQFSARSDGG